VRALSTEFPLATLCRLFEVPRSSASYKSVAQQPKDLTRLKTAIEWLRVTHRGFGVRRMYILLGRNGIFASRTEVRRAYKELGILKKPAPKTPKTTNSRHQYSRYPNLLQGRVIDHPDQVWAGDVTYVRIQGRFFYLALLMDIYTRYIVGWGFSRKNNAQLTISALRQGLSLSRSPEILHHDQGSTYACPEYIKIPKARGIQISMAEVGEPEQNGHAERLNRTVKEEEIYLSNYYDFEDAYEGIASFIERYNHSRIHSSLRYQTPSEVFEQWHMEQAS
jgi:transposase InsO family protein